MSKYIVVESRDPFDSRDCDFISELVQGLSKNGNEVSLFLIQNGVLPARKNTHWKETFSTLRKSNVTVLADSFSLQERGIPDKSLIEEVVVSGIDELVRAIAQADTKVIWH